MKTINATLLLVIKGDKILLAEKKRSFGEGKLNGVGGKVDAGETVEQAMLRETREEIGITPTKYEKMAVIEFDEWIKGERVLMVVHVFVAVEFKGTPTESEEMRPHWFKTSEIPYQRMFIDDSYWLPHVLKGDKIKANFEFDETWNLLGYTIKVVKKLQVNY